MEEIKKEILFFPNGNDLREVGGIQTFGRILGNFFPKKLSYIILFQKSNNIKFQIINKTNYCLKKNNLILKILNKVLNQNLYRNIFKWKVKTLNYEVAILSSPQELKYNLKKECKKILVQHTLLDGLWKRREYFNEEIDLLNKCKEELSYFITLSDYDKKELVEKYKFPEVKVKTIRHSSEISILEIPKIKAKKLVMITRLANYYKRIDLAIEGMELLKDYELNIYGDGPDEKMLKNLVVQKKLTNVYFHGSTDKILEKLDENSIFIMTSDFEGYGISLIEAMRRGLPIVLRNTYPASKDIVQENGILLDKEWDKIAFAKAVENCYKNFEKYSKRSIKLGRRHDMEIIKKEWESILIEEENER